MRLAVFTVFAALFSLLSTGSLPAQDLGPGARAAEGKSLADIKKELKMPEYADWAGQDRLGVNIDVAYSSLKGN
jgi:hypothetical protein